MKAMSPAPIIDGCSQAVWLGIGGPALVRNYDFPLEVVSDRFEATFWSGREGIAKVQRPWGGCLDGMNEDGLVASLTAGGSPAQGRGFSIILMLGKAGLLHLSLTVRQTCVVGGILPPVGVPSPLPMRIGPLPRGSSSSLLW